LRNLPYKEARLDILFRRFSILMGLLVLGGILLGLVTLYLPLRQSFTREAESGFDQALVLHQQEAAFIVSSFENSIELMASRSAIRDALTSYLEGSIAWDEMQAFVQPRYEEGARVIPHLVQASRFTPDGKLVAQYGEGSFSFDFSPDNLGTKLLQDLLGPGSGYFLVTTAVLRKDTTVVGYDRGIFTADMLVDYGGSEIESLSLGPVGVEELAPGAKRIPLNDSIDILAHRNPRTLLDARIDAFFLMGMYTLSIVGFALFLGYFVMLPLIRRMVEGYVETNLELEKANESKALLLKEVHHRIKNNMNTVASLLELQSSMIESPTAVEALMKAVQRLQSMTLLYDRLYRKDDVKVLSVSLYLTALVHEVVAIFPQSSQIQLDIDMEDCSFTPRVLSPLGIIINELITNAVKYAFAPRDGGVLTVWGRIVDEHYHLSLQDDGPGVLDESVGPEEPIAKESFGLELVQILVRQLRATLVREDGNPGTRWIIQVPLEGLISNQR